MRELLTKYGYPGDDTPIIRRSSLPAMQNPKDDPPASRSTTWSRLWISTFRSRSAIDQPFLMRLEDVFSIKGRGTVATGRIERGRAKMRSA